MQRAKIVTGEYYHIYNRGIEKRDIYRDEADYWRFLLGVREFNNLNPVSNLRRYSEMKQNKCALKKEKNELVVELVCYSIMQNHFHFIIKQLKENGVSKFMQKVGTGYAMYFNKRYERTGSLFEGRFKSKHIVKDEYLIYLSRYIHLNALSILQPGWEEHGVSDEKKAVEFLMEYKWHSLPFWMTNKNCIIKLHPDIVLKQFKSKEGYKDFLLSWQKEDLQQLMF